MACVACVACVACEWACGGGRTRKRRPETRHGNGRAIEGGCGVEGQSTPGTQRRRHLSSRVRESASRRLNDPSCAARFADTSGISEAWVRGVGARRGWRVRVRGSVESEGGGGAMTVGVHTWTSLSCPADSSLSMTLSAPLDRIWILPVASSRSTTDIRFRADEKSRTASTVKTSSTPRCVSRTYLRAVGTRRVRSVRSTRACDPREHAMHATHECMRTTRACAWTRSDLLPACVALSHLLSPRSPISPISHLPRDWVRAGQESHAVVIPLDELKPEEGAGGYEGGLVG